MTIHEKLPLTAAETALVDSFGERVGRLPGNGETVTARDAALSALRKKGLPTRRVEAWHYTDLRRLLTNVPDQQADAGSSAKETIIPNALLISMLNGQLMDDPAVKGATSRSVAELLRADVGGIDIAPKGDFDAIGQINASFVSGGVQMLVAEGAALDHPVEIQSVHRGGQVHTRNSVTFGRGSSGLVIDRHIGSDDPVLASNVTELTLDADAEATWIIVQEQGLAATHLGQINITLGENAKLTLFAVNASGKLVRQEVHARVEGEGADLAFRCVNLLGEEAHCDVTLELDHAVPNTTSTEVVRSVVTGQAQGVFQGQIRVHQVAQKTDAQMACNTLLLSDNAGFSVKPELEIFADDVICAHGATVTEIDSNHLFYLMARGITEKSARGLLVKAFVAEIVEELEDEHLIEALETRIDEWLNVHG